MTGRMASASLLRAVENGDVAAVDEELFLGDRADNVNRDGDVRDYRTQFEGVITNLNRRYKESTSDYVRNKLEDFMVNRPCAVCEGTRLHEVARAVQIGGQTISEIAIMPVLETLAWVRKLDDPKESPLDSRQTMIAESILKEVTERLQFLINVGLDYLMLQRSADTLSGGEAQRIRLATQIGSLD